VPLPEVQVTPLHPERFAEVLAGDGFARFEHSIATAHALPGNLVEPRDLRRFGERVSELLGDPHGAERMRLAAQRRVRDLFLGPRHLGQYVDLIERVLSARDARRSPDSLPTART
jgi:hypothetical protein